jgi:AcrR family transcriptional regulator
MSDIAAEAGVTKPTLYTRFRTKEDLYDRVLERVAQSLVSEMSTAYEAVKAASAQEATERPARVFFDWVRSHPTDFGLLFADGQGAPTGIDHCERALGALTDIVTTASVEFLRARGLEPGRATGLLAAFLVGVFQHGALWAVENQAVDGFDVASFSAQFVLTGLEGVSPEAISSLRPRRSS